MPGLKIVKETRVGRAGMAWDTERETGDEAAGGRATAHGTARADARSPGFARRAARLSPARQSGAANRERRSRENRACGYHRGVRPDHSDSVFAISVCSRAAGARQGPAAVAPTEAGA